MHLRLLIASDGSMTIINEENKTIFVDRSTMVAEEIRELILEAGWTE